MEIKQTTTLDEILDYIDLNTTEIKDAMDDCARCTSNIDDFIAMFRDLYYETLINDEDKWDLFVTYVPVMLITVNSGFLMTGLDLGGDGKKFEVESEVIVTAILDWVGMNESARIQAIQDYLNDSDTYEEFLESFHDYYIDNFADEDKWSDFIKYLDFIVTDIDAETPED